jgi:ankyrin repeat protein
MTGIHLAAYFGLRETTIALLENGYNPDIKDSDGQTLEKGGVDGDSKSNRDRTWLSQAAGNGHNAVDPNSKNNKYDWTPLWWAAENGHEAVVGPCSPLTLARN